MIFFQKGYYGVVVSEMFINHYTHKKNAPVFTEAFRILQEEKNYFPFPSISDFSADKASKSPSVDFSFESLISFTALF